MKTRINGIFTFDELVKTILEKRNLIIAADESFLLKLPKGNWIGGTTPYSMSSVGGAYLPDKAFVQELPEQVNGIRNQSYTAKTISSVFSDGPDNGFSIILVPIFSEVQASFSIGAPNFPQFGTKPLIGWVSGVKLDDLGKVPAKVFDGRTLKSMTDEAMVMHVDLTGSHYADVGIVNIFEESPDAETIEFTVDSFEAKEAIVNGKKVLFAEYMREKKADVRWPLIGNYGGALVNVSFAGVETDVVKLMAPVFKGVSYRLAKPMGDYNAYLDAFREKIPALKNEDVGFTCNCMFNYKYGDLDGKKIRELNGPFVFGEIAYQLLNQTLVYLTIHNR